MKRLLFFVILSLLLQFCSQPEVFFQNLDFEVNCADSNFLACPWKITYQHQSEISIERDGENQYLKIENKDGVGFVEQSYLFEAAESERIFHFVADIKTETINGNGVSLNLGLYDEEGAFLLNKDFGVYGKIKGTTDWTTYTLSTIIPDDATEVRIGLINYGTGTALFDRVHTRQESLKQRKASTFAQNYLKVALDSIKRHALYRDSVDLEGLYEKATWIAGNAQTAVEVHMATEYLLKGLQDGHSLFMSATSRAKWENNDSESSINFSSALKAGAYGYLSVPGFHSNDSLAKIAFADTLRQQINNLYKQNIKGWIIDLRANDGGNMNPMLAGLELLFSSDTLGYLVDIRGKKEAWGRGAAFEKYNGEDYVQPTIDATLQQTLPIAVLYGNRTGSSGEIVILSFVGNEKTQSFGQASFGLTTGNSEMALPDGSYLFLAATRMADRNGKIYKGSILPDFPIEVSSSDKDLTLKKARDWLDQQNN
ncbi:MAG: hypothetical protein Sapg2KO_27820 [Saprospiraceae bacterium]